MSVFGVTGPAENGYSELMCSKTDSCCIGSVTPVYATLVNAFTQPKERTYYNMATI